MVNLKADGSTIKKMDPVEPGDEIVISGIAGRFPDSENLKHFEENLNNKIDLVSCDDRRWKLDHPDIPQRIGKVNNIGKFDADFFDIHFKQAHCMDPVSRMLLEHTFEAIVDAGCNPQHLRGSNIGVFTASCFSETDKDWNYDDTKADGLGITGCLASFFANRISYWLGVTGPSYNIDTACSSSLIAMEHAYRAIHTGLCDAAIVGAGNLCLQPHVSLQFSRLGLLSPDGKCKSFDNAANGYTRSEAVSVVYLQKAKDAKRVYATFVYAKTNCDGFKKEGITFPSRAMQCALLQDFYKECGIPPSSVTFVEAHGTGTKVGDPEEVNSIDTAFCQDRKTPLRIGSIKSNIGHTEPASGLCSIAKVIIAMESGVIPPNLHYYEPAKELKALHEKRLVVITEPTPWEGGYVAINSFGFGGSNCHILLKSNSKEKVNNGVPNDDLPRLVVVSGRTKEAVSALLNDIVSRPADTEHVKLLHDLYSTNISGHLYRGYTVLEPRGITKEINHVIEYCPRRKRPVWFVFTGIGTHWPDMCQALLRLPVFSEAIKKCDAILKPSGIDIYDILTNKKSSENILNFFVGTVAIQIGLVDLLTAIGIKSDHIIGHSIGELVCAYADGCLTAKQTILIAYSIGKSFLESKVIHGSMAVVGLSYEDLKHICPSDIEMACRNGPKSTTISGPSQSVTLFLNILRAKNIFFKELPCCHIPFHSRYVAAVRPKLTSYLRQINLQPKPRSPKWLSSSISQAEWNSAVARLSSAEYYINNLLNCVLFEEPMSLIPKDAITIEIGSQESLTNIYQISINAEITNVILMECEQGDNVKSIFQNLGKLYNAGLQPQLIGLYPKVPYPVSRSTPMISPHIKWNHIEDWYVSYYKNMKIMDAGERLVLVSLNDETFEFMSGHVIDGRNLIPATGYLQLVWETFAMMKGAHYSELSVVFQNVKFLRATKLTSTSVSKLHIMIQKGSGSFEVSDGPASVVTGIIKCMPTLAERIECPEMSECEKDEGTLTTKDIYKELRLRGYKYTGFFQGINSISIKGTKGYLRWTGNWVTFLDTVLQIRLISLESRGLLVPTAIEKLVINLKVHHKQIREMSIGKQEFAVYVDANCDCIVTGGVEIYGLKASGINKRKNVATPILEKYEFIGHRDRAEVKLSEFIRISYNLGLENISGIRIKSLEVIDDTNKLILDDLLSIHVQDYLAGVPLFQADINIVTNVKVEENQLPENIKVVESKILGSNTNAHFIIGRRLLTQEHSDLLNQIVSALIDGGFIITREDVDGPNLIDRIQNDNINIIMEKTYGKELLVLLRKKIKVIDNNIVLHVSNSNFAWITELQEALKSSTEKGSEKTQVLVVGYGDYECGLLGLVNCLRREPGGDIIRGILIQDPKAPLFTLSNSFYAEQLELNLKLNVLGKSGIWGTYRHLPLQPLKDIPVHHAVISQKIRGDMSSLYWLQGQITLETQFDIVRVVYSSINFRDIMVTTGKLPVEVVEKNRQFQNCAFGLEYSGIDSKGCRVMGIVHNRALSNLIQIKTSLCWNVPDDWSLEDAATVPVAYATCYYAFYVIGNLKKQDKILIHAGSGGVGLAAINLALYEGCEVFTTVGTPEKRKFIRDTFPTIPDNHIGNSRDTSFEQLILQETNGRGVDVVLNSLAEEKLQASIRCVAKGGRFLEIGKFDLVANNPLGMEVFEKGISFHGVMLDNMMDAPIEKQMKLKEIVNNGLSSGAIKPFTRTVFSKDEVDKAFRYMAAGKHIGKCLIKVQDENKPKNTPILAFPQYLCLQNRSYIIFGGLGGFGLELVDWLVLRGAKNIVIVSRQGIKAGYQKMKIQLWESYGVKIVIVSGRDASKKEDCEIILETGMKMGPVDGIFNLAVVLKDAIFPNQTSETFEDCFRAKVWTTKQLDVVSRKLCPDLRHFVVFSSASCGRGNAGQTNYGMANSIMERICETRVEEGLPALAIQWGAVGDVGLVAEMQTSEKEIVIAGTLPQRITSCLDELNGFLLQKYPVVSSYVIAEKLTVGAAATTVVGAVLNIMGLKNLKTISHHTPLVELGMDSMMAVEIKQTLECDFDVFLTAQDMRSLNFAKLVEMDTKESTIKTDGEINQNDESLTGIQILMRTIGFEPIIDELCLKLETKQEAGRDEVFLIPGIEGYGTIFKTVAPRIKSPCTCMQFGIHDSNQKSVTGIAQKLLPYFLTKSGNNFIIAAYSFGSLVAIELARKLEELGFSGRLVLIDGYPEQMKIVADQYIATRTDEQIQSNLLLGFMDMISSKGSSQLLMNLEKCKDWEEKLDAFVSVLKLNITNHKISETTQRGICTAVFHRLIAIKEYDYTGSPLIKSPIILLKPSVSPFKVKDKYCGLTKVTQGKIGICYVDGNHITMLENDKVVSAIDGDPIEDAEIVQARS